MTDFRGGPAIALATLCIVLLVAGCTSTGTSGTGSVRGGAGSGWENFRAEVPHAAEVRTA